MLGIALEPLLKSSNISQLRWLENLNFLKKIEFISLNHLFELSKLRVFMAIVTFALLQLLQNENQASFSGMVWIVLVSVFYFS